MLQNYLKIALRNLVKHKWFSFLNILGLALSMSVCLLIIMLIKDAYGFDQFHSNPERVFRVLTDAQRKNGRQESYASSPYIVGKTLTDDYSQVELWTPLVRRFGGEMRTGEREFNFDGMLTDASFFDMFGFELALGNPATALTEPYSLVLTDELARRIFQDENPIGKTLEVPGYATSFKINGVLKPFPGKTHLQFMALGSLATALAEEQLPDHQNISENWQDYYSTYNFVRLKNQDGKKAAETALADIAQNKYKDLELESRDAGYHFQLQPLDEITPGGNLSNSMGSGMPVFLIWFLMVLGSIIMLSACFNYTNLTIARSLIRTKEVGVRKVLGATRQQVFGQFTGEAVVTSVVALGLGYFLMKLVKPQFERLSLAEQLDIRIDEDWKLYTLFFVFALLVGLLAGIIPALTLSKTTPVAVFQKLQNIKLIQRIGLRKALLTTQFTFTLIFFIILTIAWRQTNHAITTNFGFNQPQTLLVDLQGQPFDKVSAALGQVSGVEKRSGISHSMGTWMDSSVDVRKDAGAEKSGIRDYFVDHEYLEHFGIKLVAGENFPNNPAQQNESFIIVNETFLKNFDLGEPGDAIGKSIILGDSSTVAIRGVVEDFPFKPAFYAMEPLLLRYDPSQLRVLNLRLTAGNIPASMAALERTWKQLGTQREFRAQFYDETVRENFADMLDLSRIVGFFGVLGLVIACMGLLGMAMYTVESKAKEISIRKVMGASVGNIIITLSKGYFILLGLALLIAIPISYFAGSQMLQLFAERIPLSIALFLPGAGVLLLVAGLTIGSQTVRAALANPVKSLRTE